MYINLGGDYPHWTLVHSEKIIEAVKYLVPFKDRDSIHDVYWDYAKAYVREYLSECSFGSCYFEDDTGIVIVYKRDDKEYCLNVDLQELVREGLKNTYLC